MILSNPDMNNKNTNMALTHSDGGYCINNLTSQQFLQKTDVIMEITQENKDRNIYFVHFCAGMNYSEVATRRAVRFRPELAQIGP